MMKYIFNFENREKIPRFNREKLLLSALQDPEQLYYMMDTQYEGIYQAEADERRRLYGANSYGGLLRASRFRLLGSLRQRIEAAVERMEREKAAVFRRGLHFYTEVETEELVPGDVVFLSRGDLVPADLRIIFSKALVVDQRLYPDGESHVPKSSLCEGSTLPDDLTALPDICLAGSGVVEGLARAIVIGTGPATYLGQLLSV